MSFTHHERSLALVKNLIVVALRGLNLLTRNGGPDSQSRRAAVFEPIVFELTFHQLDLSRDILPQILAGLQLFARDIEIQRGFARLPLHENIRCPVLKAFRQLDGAFIDEIIHRIRPVVFVNASYAERLLKSFPKETTKFLPNPHEFVIITIQRTRLNLGSMSRRPQSCGSSPHVSLSSRRRGSC